MSDEKPLTKADIDELLHFKTGDISKDTLEIILNTLPFELGFCDENDRFRWYTDNGHRVYRRSNATFGRDVLTLHHGGARPQVVELLKSFHAGTKDHYEFCLDLNGRTIYISFYAVHDNNGKYLGCFDFTGDITHLQALKPIKHLKLDLTKDNVAEKSSKTD